MRDSKELTWQATAAANILEARTRQGRLPTRKSRAGCKTCKTRHVKCDQARPACQRCIKSGRTCEGYFDLPLQRLKQNSNSLVGIQLSHSLGLEDGDRRFFAYFLSWTAPRLAGTLDKDFWCGHVLQLAVSEPVIRDAILSISLLYEHPQFLTSFHNRTLASTHEDLMPGSWLQSETRSINTSGSSSSGACPTVAKPKVDKFHALALKYYNRSIRGFQTRMDSGEATPLLALLSCLLFIVIETMRDNAFSALALFKQGAKLLRQLSLNASGYDDKLLLDLRRRFGRTSLLAAISGHPERLNGNDDPVNAKPQDFESVAEARDILFDIMRESHAFLTEAEYRADLQKKKTHTDSPNDEEAWSFSTEMTRGNSSEPIPITEEPDDGVTRIYYGCKDAATPATALPPSDSVHPTFLPYMTTPALLAKQERVKGDLRQWYKSFKQLGETSSEAAYSLLMHYHVYAIWVSVRLDPLETALDRYASSFTQILLLAERYIESKPERQTYTAESQVLPPLYFVATRCRIPSLRRKALDLIKQAPQKECSFGASSCAEIAVRLAAIEEQGLFPPDSGILSRYYDDTILPPESARIRGLEILTNRPLGIHQLRVTRYSPRDDGCWIKSIADFPL